MAHLRHHQGRRLPRRPGCGRGHVQGGNRRRPRPREDGPAVQPHARGPHRPAPVRRPHAQPRRGGRASGVLRRRSHRPHDPADAVPELRQGGHRVLQRVLRARPADDRRRWRAGRLRRRGLRAGHRGDPRLPGQGRRLRHGRLRQGLQDDVQRAHPHRRRHGHRLPQGSAARGHGVLPVPPHWPRWPRRPADRGSARRGRHPAQRHRRAVHGALRPLDQGPGPTRHGVPSHAARGPARAGALVPTRTTCYLDLTHLPKEQIEAKLPDITEFSRTYLGVDPVTEPGAHLPDRALRDGRHPHQRRCPGPAGTTTHVVPGLYAAGECACVSVHGANRLGTNSLLDINVFGRRAGIAAAEYATTHDHVDLPDDAQGYTIELVEQLPLEQRWRARCRAAQGDAGDDGHERSGLSHRGHAQAGAGRRPGSQAALSQRRRSRTRACATTPTCSRRSSLASCSTWPRWS